MSGNPLSGSATRSSQPRLRCAVYTRKSTEEGLDQEFNSLDAQREACAAFIASQLGLGWKLVGDRYDDGGISGGTMERPALQRLLQDIRERKVDVVVVYKIDRLTRSLTDFAKIVEVFDANGVSFVSVTQQFNTTTSMGRLTLNVLLSFAQFEREVTAERIRDKIAASKKKGMWMGGRVPLGYRVVDRKLVVEPETAKIVQYLFRRLLELGSVGALLTELRKPYPSGICIPSPANDRDEPDMAVHAPSSSRVKLVLMRGPLTYLLTNPVYVGKVKHHDTLYEGEHEAIVDQELFEKVQGQLKCRAPDRRRSANTRDLHLLTGLLFDETGDRLAPTSSSNHGRHYRYYVSARLRTEGRNKKDGWRLPASEIDELVVRELCNVLRDRTLLAAWISTYSTDDQITDALEKADHLSSSLTSQTPAERQRLVQLFIRRVVIRPSQLSLEVDPMAIVAHLAGIGDPIATLNDQIQPPDTSDDRENTRLPIHLIERAATLARRGQGMRIVVENPGHQAPDSGLIDLIARANYFLTRLTDGSHASIRELAASLMIHPADISRILPLAFLAPSIVRQILHGSQPANLTTAHLARAIDVPANWSHQTATIYNP